MIRNHVHTIIFHIKSIENLNSAIGNLCLSKFCSIFQLSLAEKKVPKTLSSKNRAKHLFIYFVKNGKGFLNVLLAIQAEAVTY